MKQSKKRGQKSKETLRGWGKAKELTKVWKELQRENTENMVLQKPEEKKHFKEKDSRQVKHG